MNVVAPDNPQTAAFGAPACQVAPAEVIRVNDQSLTLSLGVRQVDATPAVLGYRPAVGDRVLALGGDGAAFYVVGVISASAPQPLALSIDPATGRTRLEAAGDLELVAPKGAVRIVSGMGVDALTAGPIDLRSRTAVRFSVVSRLSKAVSQIGLIGRRATVRSERVDLESDEVRVSADRAQFDANQFDTTCQKARCRIDRLDATFGVVTASARDFYQKVAGLWQVVAQRTRMVVSGVSHHSAKRIHSKADDVKVKADKIHLG